MAGFVEITEFAGELHSEMEEIVPMKYGYIERIMMLARYISELKNKGIIERKDPDNGGEWKIK